MLFFPFVFRSAFFLDYHIYNKMGLTRKSAMEKYLSVIGEVLDMGVSLGVVQKSGSWLSYNGERLGQGRDNARRTLEENAALFAEIENKIRSMGDELAEKSAEFELEEDDSGDDLDIRLSDDE